MWPFKRKQSKSIPQNHKLIAIDANPDTPVGFGYKTTWWIFRSGDKEAVANAIGLVNPKPCNWFTGISISYENGIFISPPINGWILVTGFKLPPNGSNPESECLNYLLQLSEQFTDVQVFSTHRVVEYHVWARAINGKLVRGFGYVGESGMILWDVGDNSTEIQQGFKFPNAENLASAYEDFDAFDWPQEEHVMQMAAQWSISPVTLDENKTTGVGLLGFNAKLIQPNNSG